jgi:pyruvate dehydrogenase E2 component (dihydrolipoamide acetyltransferase)
VSRVAEIRVPDLGGFKDVAVIDVLVKAGDSVELETPLVTLETEKATMDVPSTEVGTIESMNLKKGSRVSAGDLILTLRVEDQSGAAREPPGPAPEPASVADRRPAPLAMPEAASAPPASNVPTVQSRAPPAADAPRGYAGPSVRKLARELGVDLARVTGTGIKQRITHEDVKAFVKHALSRSQDAGDARSGALPAVPVVDFAAFGKVRVEPVARIRKISARRLHASWVNLPHVTQFDEADITELEELRSQLKSNAALQGVKLTPLAFIIRACVITLQQFPSFNASLDASGDNLIYKEYINVGFAADTPNGLLVPVVRGAGHLDVYRIARELADLSEQARAGKLSAADMQGGSFTVSSLGGIGGTAFTPIINAPEVAILGVSRSTLRPVYREGAFVPRLMLPLSLSYDHRVIDGAAAARFTTALAQTLATPRALIEAVP